MKNINGMEFRELQLQLQAAQAAGNRHADLALALLSALRDVVSRVFAVKNHRQ